MCVFHEATPNLKADLYSILCLILLLDAITLYITGLDIAQGRHAGEPFKLLSWQKRFLRGMLGSDGDAALSLARGGGKSTLIAGIGAACLNGPLAEPHSETVSAFEQARIVFRHVLNFLTPEIERDRRDWRVEDSANRAVITYRPSGAMFLSRSRHSVTG